MKWKEVGHFGKRALAILLAVAFVFSGMNVASWQVKAAEEDIDLSVTTGLQQPLTADKNNNAEVEIAKPTSYNTIQSLINAGYTKLEIEYKISEHAQGGSGTPGMQPYYAYGDSWKYYTGGVWKNIADAKVGTISLPFAAGEGKSEELKRFGLQICNVSNVKIEITSAKLIKTGSSGSGSTGGSTDFGTTREFSTGVSAVLTNQDGSPSNDWSGFDMTLNNGSGTTICDWIVKLKVPSGTASAFKCWNATFVADGDTIYMYPKQDGKNAVLETGTMQNDIPGGGFASKYVDASSINVEAVYYNKGTSSEFNYSSGETNDETGGSGGNSGSSVSDTSTNKELDVEYNYAKLLQESLYFYDANMCGELEGKCEVKWRKNCHTSDKNVSTTIDGVTYNVDVSGGFHDAGDHVKFGLPQGYAATMLEMSYYQFPEAYTKNGLKSHLQTIMDYFCDYFKRCTVYDKSGKVVGFCYQVGEGGPDHGYWGPPESQTQDTRGKAYFATSSNPATDEVSVAIAALAMNYINFGNEKDLQTAKDLFTFVKNNNNKECETKGSGGYYNSDSWKDDYGLAAAALYVATKEPSYQSEYASQGYVNSGWVLDWSNTGALACMLMNDTSKLSGVVNAGKNCSTIDNLFSCLLDWGSCRYNATSEFVGLVYDKMSNTKTYDSWAVSQMNYMIGDNPNKRCYIVGYNENSSQYPHHRAASRSGNAGTTNPEHYTLLGALVGGPGKNGVYKDDQNDYNCNEVALDYNAGLVGAAAGLYCSHKDDTSIYLSYAKKETTNYSTKLATNEELSAIYGDVEIDTSKVSKVTLDKATLSLGKGESATLTATVSPATAEDKSVTWSSSDDKIATVDKTGKVTAVAAGTATITVKTTDGEKTATCKVTVTAPGITLNKETLTLKAGASETLKATVTGVADKTVTWSSDKPTIATVDVTTGKVTAKAGGTATITATVGSGANAVKATCTVTVTKNTPTVTVPTSITVKAGTSISDIPFDTSFAAKDGGKTVDGTFSWITEDSQLTYDNDGDTLTAKFTPKDSNTYDEVTDIKVVVHVEKIAYAKAPPAPTLSSKTYSTITLEKVSEKVQYGYSSDGVNYKWNDISKDTSNTFTGLSPYTTYYFALRYPETNIYLASAASKALQVTTYYSDADCYKVDLSRINDTSYVEAHNGKIDYNATTKTLTLTDAKNSYTISGSNPGVTIVVSGGTVTLNNATLKAMTSDGDIGVKLVGNNTIEEGITVKGTITLQNGNTTGTPGMLTVTSGEEAAIKATNIVLQSGQITAAGEDAAAAMKATDIITLTGGFLKADAEKGVTPIQAEKIVLKACQVESGSNPIYSIPPVDENDKLVDLCKVTYMDGDETISVVDAPVNEEIDLLKLPSKEGHKAEGWKKDGEGDTLPAGTKQTVSGNVVYVAQYIEIKGTLDISVADTKDLTYGYTADAGVKITVTNKTNVTIESIKLALKDETKFMLSEDTIDSLEAGGIFNVMVKLKNEQAVGEYEVVLDVTVTSGECDGGSKTITRTVSKAQLAKPTSKPTITNIEATKVTLKKMPGGDYVFQYGYKKAGDTTYTWKDSNEITGLSPYTTYDFALRYKENANYSASDAGTSISATTMMNETGKYTVDLEKLNDEEYVKAHDGTISYDAKKKELTLLEEEAYTITGEDSDIKIIVKESATLNLENAKLEAIDADKDIELVLKGTSNIKSTADGQPAVKAEGSVTISQATGAVGSATITGGDNTAGIKANEVTIKSGTVTVIGGEDAAGIVADTVTVSGGTVTITGQGDKPAVEATTTKFDVDVTTNDGSDYKAEGGDTSEEKGGETSEEKGSETSGQKGTTTTQSSETTATKSPTTATETPDDETVKKEEKEDEDDGDKIKPALLCSNILLQKGKSIHLKTNDDDVEITKVAYANGKSKKIVKATSSGKLTGTKTGTASLKVTYEYDDVSYTKTVKVKVQKNEVVSLTKKSMSLTLKRNKKANLVNPSNMLSSKGMKFSTSNKRYVKVSSSGVVTARRRGTAKVTVKIGKTTYTVKIKVK